MFKVIPEKVMYDKTVPPIAKLMMADIVSFSIKSLDCFIGNDKWAERYCCSKGTISKYVSLLVEKEYVIRRIIRKANTKQIIKRILIAHPNVIYSLSEVALEIEKQVSQVEEKEQEIEEFKEYKKTNLMRDFHKLWEK